MFLSLLLLVFHRNESVTETVSERPLKVVDGPVWTKVNGSNEI